MPKKQHSDKVGRMYTTKAPNTKSNRVDPEIQIPIAHIAMDRLVGELDLLDKLYEAADFTEVVLEVPEPGEGETEEDAQYASWLTKGRFFKAVGERNRAIQSQYTHIKMAAQAASGCIHPSGHNTEEEKKASGEMVKELKKKVSDRASRWEENKNKLREEVEKRGDSPVMKKRMKERLEQLKALKEQGLKLTKTEEEEFHTLEAVLSDGKSVTDIMEL